MSLGESLGFSGAGATSPDLSPGLVAGAERWLARFDRVLASGYDGGPAGTRSRRPSPVVELNRAVAVAMADGPAAALVGTGPERRLLNARLAEVRSPYT